eukprot:4757502-Pleurochrysis_carterae.AAC.1
MLLAGGGMPPKVSSGFAAKSPQNAGPKFLRELGPEFPPEFAPLLAAGAPSCPIRWLSGTESSESHPASLCSREFRALVARKFGAGEWFRREGCAADSTDGDGLSLGSMVGALL